MSALALADPDSLATLWRASGFSPRHRTLRGPEAGLIMTRGRIGGDGAPFNLGEASATRCSVRLADGVEGHAYVLGRQPQKARIAALCDALMQTDAADAVSTAILEPLAEERSRKAREAAGETAPTRVEFFTVARGDDP